METKALFELLKNPEIFQVNRLEAHSAHKVTDKNYSESCYKLNLNGIWKFKYFEKFQERDAEFFEKSIQSFDNEIMVPSHIEFNGYGQIKYVNKQYPWDSIENIKQPEIPVNMNQVGQYKREFILSERFFNKKMILNLEGVDNSFNVWVNGKYVGYSEDSNTLASFDITQFVVQGCNDISIEVYKFSSGSWLEDQDSWRFFGIFRDVYVEYQEKEHIEDLFIKTILKNDYKDADLSINYQVVNSFTGKIRLFDTEDNIVKELEHTFTGNGEVSFEVLNIKTWSAETPYIYKLEIELPNSIVTNKVGFREFKMINNIMCINGKRIYFRGVNRHDFSPRSGKVVTREQMLEDILIMKRNNMNALRTSHYPNQQYIYELCNEYGLYVIDETNLETHGTWQTFETVVPSDDPNIIPHNKKEWENAVLERGKAMFERDKNHPSIVMWSLGNEAYGGSILIKLADYFRKIDSTRLVHYEGVINAPEYNEATDVYSMMYGRVQDIKNYLDTKPQKPFINCEYSHAMGNSCGGLIDYDDLYDEYEMYQGGFIWEFFDHSIQTNKQGIEIDNFGGDFGDRPNDSNFVVDGLITGKRELTHKIHEAKYVFSPVKISFLSKNKFKIQNRNLFTNLENYSFKISILLDGVLIDEIYRKYSLEPLKEKEIELEYDYIHYGEYSVVVSVLLDNGSNYARKGYEIGFGQNSFTINKHPIKQPENKVEYIETGTNIRVFGNQFSVMFGKSNCKVSSLKYNEVEFIEYPTNTISPNFWRAVTDNDRGANYHTKLSKWRTASISNYQIPKNIKVTRLKDSEVLVETVHTLPMSDNYDVLVKYFINGCGQMTIEQKVNFTNEEILFKFGMNFRIPMEYHVLNWYGNGPYETYIDRKTCGKIGLYTELLDNQQLYSRPQAYGNKTDLRFINILNDMNKGISIQSESIFEASVNRYDAFDLESCYHSYELPRAKYTNVEIDLLQTGVAGDDSWGSWTLEKYQAKVKGEVVFKYTISPIK